MSEIPELGVGLSYRGAIGREILRHAGELDFLEIIADHFFARPTMAMALATRLAVVPHSLELSVGSQVDPAYLEQVALVAEATGAPFFSDHLAFTRTRLGPVGRLAPVVPSEEQLDRVVRNVRKVQERVRLPFALENIAAPFRWPEGDLDERELLVRVLRETGCHLLLDLENVRITAANEGRAAQRFLDGLPLERVALVHLAGGTHDDGIEHDTHAAPVGEETWSLFRYLVDVCPPPAVVLERDAAFPPMPDLLEEVRRARSILGGKEEACA